MVDRNQPVVIGIQLVVTVHFHPMSQGLRK